jgi:hypothetical protein
MRRALLLVMLVGCGRTEFAADGGTPDGGSSDAGTTGCRSVVTPDAGLVRFAFPEQPCRFTLAQAAAGIGFRYSVIVSGVDAQFISSAPPVSQTCAAVKPGPGVYVFEKVTDGGTSVYCLCDQGNCMQPSVSMGATPGRSELSFSWDGRSWSGPSDTNNPKGPPVAPGDYVFSVESVVGDSRVNPVPGTVVHGDFFFTLTP